jgi:hypothetical protein
VPAATHLPVHPNSLKEAGAAAPRHYGLLWWNNADGTLARVPHDAFWSWGLYDSLILVIPSFDIVVARAGQSWPRQSGAAHYDVLKPFFEPIVAAVNEPRSDQRAEAQLSKSEIQNSRSEIEPSLFPLAATDLRPSPVIQEIRWAPKETIRRAAKGSDNWPLTWGDDDALYTAYGDGNGFEPFTREKLSLGFGKGAGRAGGFYRGNLRAPTLEQKGNGRAGRKASGLLMVEGVLYLWSRNAGNSQLAESTDHGVTWSWSDWTFTNSFGCPTFLNFGRNYRALATNSFTSIPLTPMTLTRRRTAWCWRASPGSESASARLTSSLSGATLRVGPNGLAIFPSAARSSKIPANVTVPASPGALRCGAFCVQVLPNGLSRDHGGNVDTRFAGGLAVFDAPEPWGPWTTAFHTESWDVGPGDTASFPAKWMSPDGRTLYLVFSGEDSFSVRQATAVLKKPSITNTTDNGQPTKDQP